MPKILSKRVSNYELFFDLALVLTISQLTSAMHLEHVGAREIFTFIITNIIVLSVWFNEVWYFNKLGDSRRIDIFTLIPLMFIMGNIANIIDYHIDDLGTAGKQTVLLFNGLLIAAYVIIGLQYYLKGRILGFNSNTKASIKSCIIICLSLLPFALGLLGVTPLTVMIYLLPLILPILLRRELDGLHINFPHAVERSQLLIILTFGEAVIAIIRTYPLTSSFYQGALFFFGMSLLFMTYMSQTFLSVDHHSSKPAQLLFYAHFPIFIGINLFTDGLEFLANSHHRELGFYFFLSGIWAFYLGTLTTTYYNQKIYRLRREHYAKLLAILLLGSAMMYLLHSQLSLLAISLIATAWFYNRCHIEIRRQLREEQNIPHPDPSQNLRDFS